MKSIRYRNTIIISVVALAFVSAVILFAYNMTKSKSTAFLKDGYVLNTLDQGGSEDIKEKSEVQHFDANTKYNKRWDGTVDFKNEKGDLVKASAKGFLYYNNNDIETMDKAVLLDTNDINRVGKVTSYSMPEGTVVKKVGEGHELTNLEDKIELKDYIWKVDETKYLVVSNKIEVIAQGEVKETLDKFVELAYIEGGIVRLTNDKYNSQTIMSDTKIKLGNETQIDLNSKGVEIGGESVTSLAQMLVDSEDNVEIVQNNRDELLKQEEVAARVEDNTGNQNPGAGTTGQAGGGTTTNSTSNSTDNSNTAGVTIAGGGSGAGTGGNNSDNPNASTTPPNNGVEGDFNEDDSDSVEVKFTTPQFMVNKFDIFATELDVELEKIDKDNILSDDAKIVVFEKNGETKFPEDVWPLSDTEKTYRTTRVRPATTYVFQIQGEYKVGEEVFPKVFLEKEFTTDGLGVGFNIKSLQTDAVVVNVTKESGTLVKIAEVKLYDGAGEEVVSNAINFEGFDGQSTEVKFDTLEANTRYKVVMESLSVGRETIDKLNEGIEFVTLRKSPSIGSPIVKIDKAKQTFELSIDNIVDHSGGVRGVVYKVFNSGDADTPVVEQRRDAISSAVVKVDGTTIQQGSIYTFQAIVEYFDNEKVVEYGTAMSNPFSMSEFKLPEVIGFEVGVEGYTRFDAIKGNIKVRNSERTIDESTQATYVMSGDTSGIGDVQNGSSTIVRQGDEILIPIEKKGLRAGQSYTLTATISVDLLDGNGHQPLPLQNVTVTTARPKDLSVNFTQNSYDENNKMNFTVQISAPQVNPDPTTPAGYEASTIQELVFKVYRGKGDKKVEVGTVVRTATNIDIYESSLKTEFYDRVFEIKDEFFNLVADDFTAPEYTIELHKIYDYTNSKNEIGILGSRGVVITPNASRATNEDLRKALVWTQKTKNQAGNTTAGVEGSTIVEGTLSYNFPATLPVHKLTTRIYVDRPDQVPVRVGEIVNDMGNNGLKRSIDFKIDRGTANALEQDIRDLQANLVNPDASGRYGLFRGLNYRFDYDAEFDLDRDGASDYKVTTVGKQDHESVEEWVSPQARIDKQIGSVKGQIKGSSYQRPSTGATNRGYGIRYNVSKADLDTSLVGNRIVLEQGQLRVEQGLDANNANQDYSIGGLSTGLWRISAGVVLNKSVRVVTGDNQSERTINMGDFHINPFTDIDSATGNSLVSNNKTERFHYRLSSVSQGQQAQFLVMNIVDARGQGMTSRIVKVRVKFNETPTNGQAGYQGKHWITVPVLASGEIRIPYASIPKADLDSLKGKSVTPSVELTYDTGEFKAEVKREQNVLLQEPNNGNAVGRYYKDRPSDTGVTQLYSLEQNAIDTLQEDVQFDGNSVKLKKSGATRFGRFFNYGTTNSTLLVQELTGRGSRTPVWFKTVASKEINRDSADTNDVVLPQLITPTVSTRGVVTGLDVIQFTTVINQASSDRAESYKVELYTVGDDTTSAEKIGEQVIPRSTQGTVESDVFFGGDTNVNILPNKSMTINTSYDVRVVGTFTVAGNSVERRLLDTSTGNEFEVRYRTEGEVNIADIRHSVRNKKLVIGHTLAPVTILEKLEYRIRKQDGTSQTITKNKNELSGNMSVEFPLSENFPLGETYVLTILPFAKDSSKQTVELPGATRSLRTLPLEEPRLTFTYSSDINATNPGEAKLSINFTVTDEQGATDNIKDAMTLQLVDESGARVDKGYTENAGATNVRISGMMDVSGLKLGTEYTVELKGKMDSNLDGQKQEEFNQSYKVRTVTSSGINTGDISLGAERNNLVISFVNSNNLVSSQEGKGVKRIRYTLYNDRGVAVKTGDEAFSPRNYDNGKIYTYKISHNLGNNAAVYQLRMILYDANNREVLDYNGKYIHNYN